MPGVAERFQGSQEDRFASIACLGDKWFSVQTGFDTASTVLHGGSPGSVEKNPLPSATNFRVFGRRAGRWCWSPAVLCWVWVCLSAAVRAAPVSIDSVTTTFHGGSDEDLRKCINGLDINRTGWFVAPQTDRTQAAIFHVAKPVSAAAADITLCFLSGRQYDYPGEFAVSATTDARPSLDGNWERLIPTRISSAGPGLIPGKDGRLRTNRIATDAVFQLAVPLGEKPVTGFRVDVFPGSLVTGKERPQASARSDGDFTLTQFRVETVAVQTTNIALGRPVKASGPVRLPADNLTDGFPGTFSHPLRPGRENAFYFEIDLGASRRLDHIALRNRGDGNALDRLSRVILRLYDAAPNSGATPVWAGHDRADGSHPGVGEVDEVRASDGEGRFEGRWLRLSSDSPVAFSPQFAEVEGYENLVPQLASLRIDGTTVAPSPRIRVPAGSRWLSLNLKLAATGLPENLPCRWRLRGFGLDWQAARGTLVEGSCPPAGNYVLEVQIRHSDGEWNTGILAVPIHVEEYLWRTRPFRLSAAGLAVLASAWLVYHFTRRRLAARMAALEARAALDNERTRIARDMHDEVGAGLSQLAILQEILARELPSLGEPHQRALQLAQTTRRIIDSLDEVVWTVNPENDTLTSLAGYLSQCATSYLGSVEIACRLDAPFDWPSIEVRSQVRHNLVLAFREALQNILKHSHATETSLTLRLESAIFIVLLTDNGVGFPEGQPNLGQDGLANMRARLAAIGGTCRVRVRVGGGTEVELRIGLGLASKRMQRNIPS